MPNRAVTMIVMAMCFASAPAPSWAAEPDVLQGPANAWIASHARRLKGEAPKELRKSCEGDLTGDGHAEVVLVFTVERVGGGSDWQQFVTMLAGSMAQFSATPPVQVGAKGERTVESCNVSGGVVALAGKEWAPADPACCPSRAATSRYGFAQGALVPAPAPSPGGS